MKHWELMRSLEEKIQGKTQRAPTPAYWVKIKVWSSMFLSVNSTNQWTYHSHTNQHTSADLIVLVTVLGIQNGARWEGWRPLSWQASPCVCPPSPPPSSSVFVFICHGSAGNFLCRNKGFYFFKKGVGGGHWPNDVKVAFQHWRWAPGMTLEYRF